MDDEMGGVEVLRDLPRGERGASGVNNYLHGKKEGKSGERKRHEMDTVGE